MKTFSAKPNEIKKEWLLFDASGKTLGRLSSEIARRLRGKHKVEYTPHVDVGDYIIVINAKKIFLTGNKPKNKIYYHYTGYIGGIKSITFDKLLIRNPKKIIEKAVKGMLPKNSLGRLMYKKLKVYDNEKHPHIAQQPRKIDLI